ncbi:MAG: hypothetical protein K0R90_1453 [Oscillospiraceae bacterium]|jgi:hypothetical protein|nr:hypothetical protein [Oscillospiraceae bacterium]
MKKYSGLNQLIQQDPKANDYFNKLPDYVKEQISTRADNVNSIQSLKDYAENLLRGDD